MYNINLLVEVKIWYFAAAITLKDLKFIVLYFNLFEETHRKQKDIVFKTLFQTTLASKSKKLKKALYLSG